MTKPVDNVTLFIATQPFAPSDGERWSSYFEWANIPGLEEIVGLDSMLCPRIVTEFVDEDWEHMVCEDYRLGYFHHLEYLRDRVKDVSRRNILGLYRNPDTHLEMPPGPGFMFCGYDLIEEMTQISAINNCGGFPETFQNCELNQFGLIGNFVRASEVRRLLQINNPQGPHANCELYAIWRLQG